LGNFYDALRLLEDTLKSEATQLLFNSPVSMNKLYQQLCSSLVANANIKELVNYNLQILESLWLACLIYIKLEYLNKAKKLLFLLADIPDSVYNNSTTHYLLAVISYIQGNIPLSLEYLDTCILKNGNFWPAKYLKGGLFYNC
jgi:hypothetical protein